MPGGGRRPHPHKAEQLTADQQDWFGIPAATARSLRERFRVRGSVPGHRRVWTSRPRRESIDHPPPSTGCGQVSTAILGFPGIFEDSISLCSRASGGLEQFGRYSSVLGKIAEQERAKTRRGTWPFRRGACNQPVQEPNGRNEPGTNHLHVTRDILWKTSSCQQNDPTDTAVKTPHSIRGYPRYAPFKA